MYKYIVYFKDGRQCEVIADYISHFSDEIIFQNKIKKTVAWFDSEEIAGYVLSEESKEDDKE